MNQYFVNALPVLASDVFRNIRTDCSELELEYKKICDQMADIFFPEWTNQKQVIHHQPMITLISGIYTQILKSDCQS